MKRWEEAKRTTLEQRLLLLFGALPKDLSFNLLGLCALNHALHIDTLQVNILGCNLSVLDDFICFDNRHFGVLAHGFVEVVLCFAELAVSETISFRDFDECVVAEYRLFHNVGFAIKFASFFGRSHDGDGTVGVVADREFAGLDYVGVSGIFRFD
jgi:hypothetical protein